MTRPHLLDRSPHPQTTWWFVPLPALTIRHEDKVIEADNQCVG